MMQLWHSPPPGQPKGIWLLCVPGGGWDIWTLQGHWNWSFKPNKRFLLEEFEGKECFHERKTIITSYNDAYKK